MTREPAELYQVLILCVLLYEPDLGPIALEITGPAGTREFLQATLGL